MPKATKRKKTAFNNKPSKACFFYGEPNKEKLEALKSAQDVFTREVNRWIETLYLDDRYLRFLLTNGNRSTEMRDLERSGRAADISATFGQASFDEAFVKCTNQIKRIKDEVTGLYPCRLTMSSVLFAMTIEGCSLQDMMYELARIDASYKKKQPRFDKWAMELLGMYDQFKDLTSEIRYFYHIIKDGYKMPYVTKAEVRLVSTNMSFHLTDQIKADAVLEVSLPSVKGKTAVPVSGSANSVRRFHQYGFCNSASYTITDKGQIRVSIACQQKYEHPKGKDYRGADVGITDCLHVSDTGAIGSFSPVIDYYKEVVEPLFGQLNTLRNQKRQLKKYIRKHNLPDEAKRQIRAKIDRLETMIRRCDKPYRKDRHYKQMLDKEIKDSVEQYIKTLKDHHTVTVLEQLDIREFNKSRKSNGMLSVFARGSLQKKLMEELNWKGYAFVEVEPAYTSQACPVCSYQSKDNRNGKDFTCKCCGHTDDADHVGSVNIKSRATDTELLELCEKYKYSKDQRHNAIKILFQERNKKWVVSQNKSA